VACGKQHIVSISFHFLDFDWPAVTQCNRNLTMLCSSLAARAPAFQRWHGQRRCQPRVLQPVRSSADEKPSADNADGLPLPKIPKQQRRRRAKPTKPDEPFSIAIDDLNPVTSELRVR
jgi:hypothetical protein